MTYQNCLAAFSTATLLAMGMAAQADVVIATWGGGGANTLRQSVAEPFTKESGIKTTVAEVPNTAGAVRSPTAKDYGAVEVTFFEATKLAKEGLLEPFEDSEIPNIADLDPGLVVRDEQGKVVGVTGFYVFYGIAMNTDFVKKADVTSWNDLADPKYKGKLAITRPVYSAPYDLTSFAYANGGDAKNIEPGMEALKGMYKNALTTYTSMAHMNTLLQSGEAYMAPYYSSRIWHMRKDGLKNIDITIPKEGALILPYPFVVPKGSANHAESAKVLNYIIDPKVQSAIAAETGNIPASAKAELSAEFTEIFGLTKEDLKAKLIIPDWSAIVADYENRVDTLEKIAVQ